MRGFNPATSIFDDGCPQWTYAKTAGSFEVHVGSRFSRQAVFDTLNPVDSSIEQVRKLCSVENVLTVFTGRDHSQFYAGALQVIHQGHSGCEDFHSILGKLGEKKTVLLVS